MTAAEDEILNLLKKHTPQGKCPLAGNSIGQVKAYTMCPRSSDPFYKVTSLIKWVEKFEPPLCIDI